MITTDELKVQLAEHAKPLRTWRKHWPLKQAASACRSWSTLCPAPDFMMMQN